jgi:hypothetical protein
MILTPSLEENLSLSLPSLAHRFALPYVRRQIANCVAVPSVERVTLFRPVSVGSPGC